uniref:Synaptonemal complex central element protein 1 like n=1 Tax=Aotus nancymaae TaxID=37293 RepID=A0A2K5DTX0_AOTNA
MAGKLKPLNVEAPDAAEKLKTTLTQCLLPFFGLAKKKSSEELRDTRTLQEALHRELDSLNGEKVHLEEVLKALRILQLHCQEKETCVHSLIPGLDVKGELEDLMGQHKDLWEFHMLEQRLAREIRDLERSKEQLLSESERLVRAKLREAERRLRSPPEVEGAVAAEDRLRAELEIFGEQVQSAPEVRVGQGETGPELPGDEEDPEPPVAAPEAL